VSLETSGALDVALVDKRVVKVMDLKTPGSGEVTRNLYSNMNYLDTRDEVKFVICNKEDYQWARFKIDEYQLVDRVGTVLMSASHEILDPALLAEWILQDKLNVRLQIQLHKYLWGNKQGV
jgi:7-carboxy-7-deazaguanine synthase